MALTTALCAAALSAAHADDLNIKTMILKHAALLLPRFAKVVLIAPFVRFTDSFPARLVRSMPSPMPARSAVPRSG